MAYELPLSTLDNDELAELRSTVREVATEAGYPASARDLEDSPTGLDEDLWRMLAEEIGLAGVGLPESAGGLGGLAEILAVVEELGATLAPVPFLTSTVIAGQLLAQASAHQPAAEPYLERICGGEIAAAAITDQRGALDTSLATCTADLTRATATVTGSARFVAYGASAAFFVVTAQGPDGIDLYAVEAADTTVTSLTALDFTRPMATVVFADSPAVALTTGGGGQQALAAAADVALLAVAADQLGGSQACFDLTLEYIKLRRQFNREIGSFQAIKHRMADALMLVEMARSGVEKVTSGTGDDMPADAAMAKAWCSEAYMTLAAETIQLHGGVGFTWEHDAHLYFRRARFDSAFLGDAAFQRERLATLLGW